MGAWGTGIFESDAALDVRNIWREALMDGLDDEAATMRVLHELGQVFADEDEFVVGWTALAAAQTETGRLQPLVRQRALEIIEAGGDVESWRLGPDPALARPRKKALQALAAKLRGPQLPPKTLKRPRFRPSPLDMGDVVHVRNEEGEGLFVVVALAQSSSPPGEEPVLAQLLWDGGQIPDKETLATLPLLHEEPDRFVLETHRTQYQGPVQVLHQVGCPTRGKYALVHHGTVVARNVMRPDAADPMRDQSRGFGDGPVVYLGLWDRLLVGDEWHARRVESTRRVYGL